MQNFSSVSWFLPHVFLMCGTSKDSVSTLSNVRHYVMTYECTFVPSAQHALSYTSTYTSATRRNFKGLFYAFRNLLPISIVIDVGLPIWWIRELGWKPVIPVNRLDQLYKNVLLAKSGWQIRRLHFCKVFAAVSN